MFSRDTTVHVVMVAAALAALAVVGALPLGTRVAAVVTFVGVNGLVLAGAHLVLALRGEDGLVPVETRWRFVVTVAALLSFGAIAIWTDPVALGPVTSHTAFAWAAGAIAVGYLLLEARAGYRDVRSTGTDR